MRAGRGRDAISTAPPFPTIPATLAKTISSLPTGQFALGPFFPCNFFYEKGKKCFKSADRCEFSHQFEAPGLRNHTKIHPLDLSKYELPAPPASPGREIIQPIIQVIDCRDCGKAHAPDKCKKKRASFSGHARAVDQGSCRW